jgi:uncharacterized membrane protein
MATLCALRFSSCRGADDALDEARELIRNKTLNVTDAGLLTWESPERPPNGRWRLDVSPQPQLNEAFWGMLFGLLFYLPLAADLAGRPAGSNPFSLAEFGISDDFCTCVRDRVRPGTSILFLLATDATVDRVIAALRGVQFTIASTNLTNRQLAALHAAFIPSRIGLQDAQNSGVP